MRWILSVLFVAMVSASCTRDEVDGFDQEIQYAQDYELDAAGDTVYMIFMPNAFTPDGDGVDDYYYAIGIGIDQNHYSMKIFARDGSLVFSTTDMYRGFAGNVTGYGDLSATQVLKVKIDLLDTRGNQHLYDYDILMFR